MRTRGPATDRRRSIAFVCALLAASGACIPDVAPTLTRSDAGGTGGAGGADATSSTTGAGGAACVPEALVDLCKGGCVAARDRCGEAVDCGPCASWAKVYGGPGTARAAGVAIDGAGDVVVVGTFSGTVDLGDGPRAALGLGDLFVVKLDPSGAHLWSRTFGGNDGGSAIGDAGLAVAFDGVGDVVLTGAIASTVDFGGGPLATAGGADVFVAKLDPDGANLWSRRFGTPADGERGTGVAVDPFGDVVVSATVTGAVDFGDGKAKKQGAVLVKLGGADGATRWSWGPAATLTCLANGVAVDGEGSALVTGCFYGGFGVGKGIALSAPGYGREIFLVKLDAAGAPVWAKQFGDEKDQCGTAVGVDPFGDIVLAGSVIGGADFGGGKLTGDGAGADGFAAGFDGAGKHRFSRIFPSPSLLDDQANAARATPDGHMLVVGDAIGAIDLGGGAAQGATSDRGGYLLELDGAGSPAWSRRIGGASTQDLRGVARGPRGELALAGSAKGPATLDGITIGSAGGYHALVAKLAH